MSERVGYIMMAIGLFIVVICMTGLAQGHTMSETECRTFAWDVKQSANDRDHGVTLKQQMAVLAGTLDMCHDPAHRMTCIYKDDTDDAQAINALNRVYDEAGMTPKQLRDEAFDNCINRLMESVLQSHGAH